MKYKRKEVIGDATLYLGDCLEVMAHLEGADTVVTDPPFNIGYHYSTYKDNVSQDDYFDILSTALSGGKFVLIHYPEDVYRIAFHIGLFPEKIVSWVYNSNTPRQQRSVAFFGIKPDFTKIGQPYKNPKDKRIAKRIAEGKQAKLYDWWHINQVKNTSVDKTSHPCQMPYEVMRRTVGVLPDDVQTILDPFMGSGTTGVAALAFGRKFIGIELDDEYFDIACHRIRQEYIKQKMEGHSL